MSTKTQVIKNFLSLYAKKELADLYTPNMECQVNVAQDEGQPIEGEFKGKKWRAWTDGAQTWKSFRIPYNAMSNPTFEDSDVKFDFAKHVEGIGMTGWNFKDLRSEWVAYDFDAIIGHKDVHEKKLTLEEIEHIVDVVKDIPWVQVRKSSSGKGLHFYVYLDVQEKVVNHHEHAALARAILSKISAIAAFDFQSKVDASGTNIWVWHRKSRGTTGFEVIKNNTEKLSEVPVNWKDHIKVVKGVKKRIMPDLGEGTKEDAFDELAGQYLRIPLDEEHKKLIEWLKNKGDKIWWWDTERHMLVTHTRALKEAHTELCMRGIFDTISEGKDLGTQNCFMHPLRKGAWAVRRFSPGCTEHETWTQDKKGWTHCYLNANPDLQTAARSTGGVELPSKGGFQFHEAEMAVKAAQILGTSVILPPHVLLREAVLKEQKDGKVVVEVQADKNDPIKDMQGWARMGTKWKRVYEMPNHTTEMEVPSFDDSIRHTVTELERVNTGWYINVEGHWQKEPLEHVRAVLANFGQPSNMVQPIVGLNVQRSWREVNLPFQPEYPGNRDWNRRSAQLRFVPNKDVENLKYDSWNLVLNHLGTSLDSALRSNEWAKQNSVLRGGDYLKCWIASMIQKPFEPLPYLFFYGPQDCGKSIFHEALNLMFTRGLVYANHALMSQSGFNGELANAILGVIEEVDLSKAKYAYNRVKDWVTSKTITIHEKGKTPYGIPNSCHFTQISNDPNFCPTFSGDTRITVIRVDALDPLELIPKMKLLASLEKEASDFLGYLTTLELPEPIGRLYIPVITTSEKMNLENLNINMVEKFVKEKCHFAPGYMIKYGELFNVFLEWLPSESRNEWTKQRFGKDFPSKYPKGNHTNNQMFIGNISFAPPSDMNRRPYTLNSHGAIVEEGS